MDGAVEILEMDDWGETRDDLPWLDALESLMNDTPMKDLEGALPYGVVVGDGVFGSGAGSSKIPGEGACDCWGATGGNGMPGPALCGEEPSPERWAGKVVSGG